jgi:hypothetical protein
VVWCGVVWCGVVWCGVVWCGVVWCGVIGAWVQERVPLLCRRSNLRLIVVDSIAALFRGDYSNSSSVRAC